MAYSANENPKGVETFLERWRQSAASERANFQSFLNELCDVLEVPRPDPATEHPASDSYVYERPVTFHHTDGTQSTQFIDLYKRGCFVLEAKQAVEAKDSQIPLSQDTENRKRKSGSATRGTKGWDTLMRKARNQAERYARALPTEDGRPPFLIVLDVGHAIELYSEFSRTGGNYVPFPDPTSHRINLEDLAQESTHVRLRALWTDPMSLDPTQQSAAVTRDIAERLARLARSLENEGHAPEFVAGFLMRCLFTMFAEDVGLLPKDGFQNLLVSLRGTPEKFAPMVETLWQTMKKGGFSGILRDDILHFNGKFFDETDAIVLNDDQLTLLIEASKADWSGVEPAIFGTLLERALDPSERHKLGAHFTPRAYVERLVMPTIIEPLREEWAGVEAAAEQLRERGEAKKAVDEIRAFHDRLCHIRVLDPACGSGNFLYVTLENLKRLEGEVLEALADFGESRKLDLATVSPEQFLGIEINPRAAAIAELVLWIGYLQWHFRTRGSITPSLPVIKSFHNIECRDAVLVYDEKKLITDAAGKPVTHWDGRTTKHHPATGNEVPDETAQVPSYEYRNPSPAQWPPTDFVVGNPPFVGNKRMRDALGHGYVDALRSVYPEVPKSADLVMYWWHKAANLTRESKLRRFGLITTNSFTQTFNRRIPEFHIAADKPLSILFAIPDHPWVDTLDGAAVRIAMTVAEAGRSPGVVLKIAEEFSTTGELGKVIEFDRMRGRVHPDLTLGADLSGAIKLLANQGAACRGVIPVGMGFVLTQEEVQQVPLVERRIVRRYLNGRDLVQTSRNVWIIDAYGLSKEEFRENYPTLYQLVLETVKPKRDQVRRKSHRERWWIFAEPRATFRPALAGLSQFIATPQVSKHAIFALVPAATIPDDKLIAFALDDSYHLGILSSHSHRSWSLCAGSRLGFGNDPVYDKTRCFDTFPFPDPSQKQREKIRQLAQQIDTHRKRRQALHPELTLTGMYNVVEKIKSGENLTDKEKTINEEGLCEVVLELHQELDYAVLEAYGWEHDITDDEIVHRLVALNAERAGEEAQGKVRWLRPEIQAPDVEQEEAKISIAIPTAIVPPVNEKQDWPKLLPERARAVQQVLRGLPGAGSCADISSLFKGGRNRQTQVSEILDTLTALGQVREVGQGRYLVN